MFLPVFWRRLDTRASPTRPNPFGSSVPRAKVTATSGQLSALADGTALGATSVMPAASNAAAVKLKRRDQARRGWERVLRLMLTRRF
ncbi:hypothetical protein GCM10009641_06880 [Mycobacterium cookii]|uniref:Uncharacterized protein n=1 Tax=Mycobacterium cookii TaxID=1775 RepID=A0A7I7L2M3_9MYCO|nr:hypothetical protein MCOO_42820 [Mycobacterium cookii]